MAKMSVKQGIVQEGISLRDWFGAQHFNHPDEVAMLKGLLKLGWLV